VNQKPGGRAGSITMSVVSREAGWWQGAGEFVMQLIADEQAESLYEILLYTLANETRRETLGAGHEQRAGKSPTPPSISNRRSRQMRLIIRIRVSALE
jgi:hypothetical protein